MDKMKMKMKSHCSLFLMFLIAFTRTHVRSSECENVKDFCPTSRAQKQAILINGLPCENPANTSAHDFKSMELSKGGSRDDFGSSVKIVTASEFLGLNTLGLSIGRSDIEVDGLVKLHNHPRATEMVFVSEGVVLAAFLSTQNQLFTNILQPGEVFVIPKGLFHYFLNRGVQAATVFSVFNSQNPGLGLLSSVSSDTDKIKRKVISLSDSELHGLNDFTSALLDIIDS